MKPEPEKDPWLRTPGEMETAPAPTRERMLRVSRMTARQVSGTHPEVRVVSMETYDFLQGTNAQPDENS